MHERVAYVLVSLWKHPACIAKRFETLPRPRFTLTDSHPPRTGFPTVRRANVSGWRAMYGKTSRDAKQQFVLWLSRSNFTHAWHLEDDAFATNWTRTLSHRSPLPDLSAPLHYDPRNFYYRSYKPKHSRHITRWPVLWMSRSLARFIVEHRRERGHHEVMTHDMCPCLHGGRGDGACHNASMPGIELVTKWMHPRTRIQTDPRHPVKCSRW